MFGSLIDFGAEERTSTFGSWQRYAWNHNQIVYNLPIAVQDRLDRDKIESIDDLLKELKKN